MSQDSRRTHLQQLHEDILKYLTTRTRIWFADELRTYNEFVNLHHNQYCDYSRECLRQEFLTTILPKIFTYPLTEIQRQKVELFATHHNFVRDEEGFREGPITKPFAKEGEHYVRSEADEQSSKVACVLVDSENFHEASFSDPKINAWASAIISSDCELVNYSLYRGVDLQSRVTKTQEKFQEIGEIPSNMNADIGKKIVGFRNIAEKLSAKLREK